MNALPKTDPMPSLLPTESRPVRTQFLLFTLFGDHVMPRGGKIWTGSLICLMDLLGVSERAVRSTLSRMTRKNWLASERYGRNSQYALTSKGRDLLEKGGARIFENIFTNWDGYWQMVIYSLPEKKRRKRHILRSQLTWLGFGCLAPGTWICPHDRRVELEWLFTELGVSAHADMFSGHYLGPADVQELVQRCWDLGDLETQYRDFIGRYQPEYEAARDAQLRSHSSKDCFLRRICMTHEFQSYPLKDPNLPIGLLSPDWIGFRARKLFHAYHGLLGKKANQFVDDVMNAEGRPS